MCVYVCVCCSNDGIVTAPAQYAGMTFKQVTDAQDWSDPALVAALQSKYYNSDRTYYCQHGFLQYIVNGTWTRVSNGFCI